MRIAVLGAALAVFATQALAAAPDPVAAGRYQAILGDCDGCHIGPDGRHFAGGVALATPFGKLVAPNITQDRETGIGRWRLDEFRRAVKQGIGRGGKRLYPAMPYPAYTKMSDDDVLAIRAYLKTIAPVRNGVEANQLPFPFNIRLSMTVWNQLNFSPGRFEPDSGRSPEWNRGAYIVEGAGHCGTCHSPKTLLGGDKSRTPLAGATLQGWFAPAITNDKRKGLGTWTKEDLTQYLKTGANQWTLASGPMAEVVDRSTSRMTDDDIRAIATYLKGDDPTASDLATSFVAVDDPIMRAGAAIYLDNCAACHKASGIGEARLFPRLAGSALVQSDDPITLTQILLQGTRAVSTADAPTAPAMPAFGWRLNDSQVAAVLTYVRNSWGNAAKPVTASSVANQRTSLAKAR